MHAVTCTVGFRTTQFNFIDRIKALAECVMGAKRNTRFDPFIIARRRHVRL
jgi:hypothetical protein